jgi:hypothetical protein
MIRKKSIKVVKKSDGTWIVKSANWGKKFFKKKKKFFSPELKIVYPLSTIHLSK